ncbi:MAG: SURF1 family protein [Pseudolabrys sp.]|nr:SURF1 family protein [Pseudolabrys sp.]MBV9954532.1 SURF1 family protein [Pseudolabrys sp.]
MARRGVLDATVTVAAGLAILVGLGVWQLDRRAWKEDLIARTAARLNTKSENLPPRVQWDKLTAAESEFQRVEFPAELIPDQEALVYTAGSAFRPDVSGAGYWVLAPVRLAGGSVVVINRGFVPLERRDPANRPAPSSAGVTEFTGVLRWPDARGLFTPADEPARNVWYVRDAKLIAAAKGWGDVAPFLVDQEAPQNPGGVPRVGPLSVRLSNNHLQYALTWFGLALGLAGIYVTWLVTRLRRY